MSASPYGRGFVGLLKKGWNEIPGVMGSTIFGVAGVGMLGYITYVNYTRGLYPNKYKREYMVVRPDDPLVKAPVNPFPQ